MSDLRRKNLWVAPFNDFVDGLWRKPFAWGVNDCGPSFAGKAVEVLTGVDLYSRFAGCYDDAVSGYRVMRQAGFSDLADLVASLLPEYYHPSQAHVGDIAAVPVDTAFGHALGIFNGERILVMTETGVGTLDRSAAARAFRVG